MTTPNTHAVRQLIKWLRSTGKHWSNDPEFMDAADALAQLVKENERLRKDAERYKFLRDMSLMYDELPSVFPCVFGEPKPDGLYGDHLDAAIDAALATQAGTSGKDEK